MTDLLAMTTDINGKPIPVWQDRLEQMYTDGVPFGEILSLVRAIIDDKVIERILAMSDEEALASIPNPDQFAAEMRQRFDTVARLVRERDQARAAALKEAAAICRRRAGPFGGVGLLLMLVEAAEEIEGLI